MCDTPSHGSDHLWLIWKESIQNCRCYRADTAAGTDGRTDGQTDGRTDRRTEWNQYTPQQLRCHNVIRSLWHLKSLTSGLFVQQLLQINKQAYFETVIKYQFHNNISLCPKMAEMYCVSHCSIFCHSYYNNYYIIQDFHYTILFPLSASALLFMWSLLWTDIIGWRTNRVGC